MGIDVTPTAASINDQLVISEMSEHQPRQRRKDARPQELLDAALALFVEKGFAATRSEEVASLAGVSKGTLYLYYPSKEELLKAVVRSTLAKEVAAGAQQLATHAGSSTEALQDSLLAWWVRVYNSPASGVFKLLLTEMCNFPELAEFYTREVIEPGEAIMADLLRQGITRGEFRPVNVDMAVRSITMPMVMLCVNKHSLGACGFKDVQPEAFMREHLQLLLNGIRADGASAAPPSHLE